MDRYADDPGVGWHFIDNTGIPEGAREVGADDGLRLLGSVDTVAMRVTKLTKVVAPYWHEYLLLDRIAGAGRVTDPSLVVAGSQENIVGTWRLREAPIIQQTST